MSADPDLNWTLEEWLDYLENRHKPEVQLRLINAQTVAAEMQLLDWSIPVITVGGTNGKGSTVAALSAIYEAAGYRVGQFTSPHLLRFNERICINQHAISDEDLCSAFVAMERGRQKTPLTYFEMSFLAALLYFKTADLDVMILEVGVGGRLDATNIIDADLSIITTVDLDHQAYLGEDKESIGLEKSGILRPHKPFIYADNNPPDSVISQANALQTEFYCLGKTYAYEVTHNELHIHRDQKPAIVLPVPKIHLNAAVAAVLATERLHERLPVKHQDWVKALQSVQILGRQQWVKGPVTVIYDVAHNPQAARLLARNIEQYQHKKQVHVIVSALNDKDICGLIRPFGTITDHWYPTVLKGKRATTEEDILLAFESVLGCKPLSYSEPTLAYQAAMNAASPGDIVVIYGSFLLVSAVMRSVV